MCQICAAFTPHLLNCSYEALPTVTTEGPGLAPGDTITESGDATSTTSTNAAIGVGEFFLGNLSSGTDVDWIEVTLEAGTYTFAATAVGPLSTALNDTTLTLRDENGVQVEFDDDGGPGRNSQFTVAIAEETTFYIDVASYLTTDAGTYGVSVVEGNVASYNAEMGAGNLMRPNEAWVTTPGTEVDLTWGFRATGNDPVRNTPLIAMNAEQTALTIAAMAYVDAISGLNFTQVAPGATTNSATLLFGAYNDPSHAAGAYAYFPGANGGDTSFGARQGDVWLNNQSFYQGQAYGFGTYTSYTMLHEIGHAIGLAHPGEYNAGAGNPITYANSAQFIQDSMQYTVMSYFDETNTGVSGGLGFPDTFMLHDFLAIHQLYGADITYNAGNTVYGFNATDASSVYDFTTNTTPFMTVYDGQGIDRIDLSGYAMAQWLSLEEGVFSNVGGYVGNFSIAYGAVIENATGGAGTDTITGNDANNVLDGNNGNDVLIGGEGNDTLNGGGQWDLLEGGEGRDSLSGGTGNDTLDGGEDNDFAFGGQGNDLIMGGGGRDRLVGAKGDDTIDGGNFHDQVIGNEGNDILRGGNGNDVVRGGVGNDVLQGDRGDDSLFGGADFDTLDGGEGNDTLTGNFNADRFIFNDNHGVDIITDFAATNDFERIDFSNLSTINTLEDLLGNGVDPGVAVQQGNDVLIDTGGGNSILLQNVLYADLDALDFIF